MPDAPQRIDRYLLERELGRGAFGAVYRATHAVMRRSVALKVLHPERLATPTVLERFLGEARTVAAIGSPHIVQVFDAGLTPDGRAFVAMELLEGEDLAAHLVLHGRLPASRAIEIAREVCEGLAAAHDAGVIHRDLKPANIYLARGTDGRAHAKVLDFGVSKMMRSDAEALTLTGAVVGTPHYMAPEQLGGSSTVDARADLYALGTVLYEMLSGSLPYAGTTMASLIAAKVADPPRPLREVAPDVPPPLAALVLRLLARDPADRFASAREAERALAEVAARASWAGGTASSPGSDRSRGTNDASAFATARTLLGQGASTAGPTTVESLPGIVNASIGPVPGTTEAPFRRLLVALGLGVAGLFVLGVLASAGLGALAYVEVSRAPAPPAATPLEAPSAPLPVVPTGSGAPLPPPFPAVPPSLPAPSPPSAPGVPPVASPMPPMPPGIATTPPGPVELPPGPPPSLVPSGGRWAVRVLPFCPDDGSGERIAGAARPHLERCPAAPGFTMTVQTLRSPIGGGEARIYPTDDRHDPASRCALHAFEDAMREQPPGTGICRFEVAAE